MTQLINLLPMSQRWPYRKLRIFNTGVEVSKLWLALLSSLCKTNIQCIFKVDSMVIPPSRTRESGSLLSGLHLIRYP